MPSALPQKARRLDETRGPDVRSTISFPKQRVESPLTMRTTSTPRQSPSTTNMVILWPLFRLLARINAAILLAVNQSAARRPQRPAATAAGSTGTTALTALDVAAPTVCALKRAFHLNVFCVMARIVCATAACSLRDRKSHALLKHATRNQQWPRSNFVPRSPSLLVLRHPTSRTSPSSATEPPYCTNPHRPTSRHPKIWRNRRANRRSSADPPCRSSTPPFLR